MLAVDKAIYSHFDFLKERNILLALSGGLDSMVLSHALIKAGLKFSAAHVNYKLRSNDSDDDEKFVANFCKNKGIPIHIKIEPINSKIQSNIQNTAREIRHQFFTQLRSENNYNILLTAHHQNDRVENLLINLARGSGLRGLSAMPVSSGSIFRPLLDLSKADIMHYAEENKIKWREDSSNSEDYYFRNYLRINIIPKLEEWAPNFTNNASRSASLLREEYETLLYFRREWEKKHIHANVQQLIIDIQHNQEDSFISSYLSELGFHPNTIQEISISLNKTGRQFESHDTWKAFIDRNQIILIPKHRDILNRNPITIHENQGLVPLYNSILKVSRFRKDNLPFDYKNNPPEIICIDESRIHFPLIVRPWQNGDWIRPLGMKGKSKKIQDILTDLKIPLPDKEKLLVVVSNNEIIWLINFFVSESVKITSSTSKIYSIEYINTV
ncbi:MAG: tRNA lysidine(34) synthetase TilS [Saprospiraceae bacterium]|nr:tRNA lysidine(34) synthetase TilS [Saprospiraceae bacterium]